jgi:TonB family protein
MAHSNRQREVFLAVRRSLFWWAVLSCWLLWLFPVPALAGPPEDPAKELVQPKLLNEATILYPEELLKQDPRPEGTVMVKYVVGVDGVPKELEVIESVHPVLDQRALDAVHQLRYEPGTYKGQAVEIVLRSAIEIVAPAPPEPEPPPEPQGEEGEEGEETREGPPADLGPVRIKGRIREAGDRGPIEGASVLAIPAPAGVPVGRIRKKIYESPKEPEWSARSITDADGNFELRGVPDGRVRLIVLAQGFARLDYVTELAKDEELELEYYQTRLSSNPYRTVVDTRRDEPEVTRRTITPEEINNLPGTQGDALKSIQNFPGVARAPFGVGLLVVRGSAPTDSKVYLGYHEIPQLFHFGALTSVFNSDILAQIDFIPGNFDPRFGDAIGGIINVQPRKGRRSWHGYIDSDVFDTGLLLEGPVGKGSFVLSGRRSYIDALLRVAIPDDADLDFDVAPRYYDYQAMLDYPVGGGELTLRVFGSDDRLDIVAKDANEEEGDSSDSFGTVIFFHRADIVYKKQQGPWSFLITPSYRHDTVTGQAGDIFEFELITDTFSGRAEIARQLSKRAALRVGTETQAGYYTIDARAPGVPAPGEGSTGGLLGGKQAQDYLYTAVYSTATLGATPRFTLYPGLRLSYSALIFKKMALDPRLRFAWEVGDSTTLKGGVGRFSQIPDAFEFNPVWGNPDIAMEKAVHTSLGVAHVFEQWDVTAEATLFHKYMYDLAYFSDGLQLNDQGMLETENFSSTGIAHVAGVEFLLRKNLTRNFFGWVSYTFNRALYKYSSDLDFVPFDFDQPHILTIIGVYKLPRNWQIGARFRLVSGNPQDPLQNGIYDSSANFYVPITGADNSDRAPAFHQLDLRVDKKWVLRRLSASLYLDIQNIYNRRNFEAWNYSYNYQERVILAGLPIIPSLGLKLQF